MAFYFPRLNIQCNEWDYWMKWAENADYNVVMLKMKEEFTQKFDLEKAWKRYYELEDTPYGISNFFFGWLDTHD